MSIPSLSDWLMEATLRGSALIVCVWLLRPFFRRWFGARASHLLWIAVLAQLLVPWLPESPLSLAPKWIGESVSTPAPVESVHVSVTVEDTAGEPTPERATSIQPASRPFPHLFIIWIAGLAGVSTLALVRAVRAARLVGRAPEITDRPQLRAVFAELPDVPQRLRVCETGELRSPALCGIVRPTVLLPAGWAEQFTSEELRCVLQHEIGHFRRGDLVWHWAFLLARAVHWFNPLVWLAERSARADQEMACDEWVISRSSFLDERVYGEVLLKASRMLGTPRLASPIHATMAESKAGLTRRIRHLAQVRSHGWRAAALALVLATCLLMVLAPSGGRAQEQNPARSAPSTAPQSVVDPLPERHGNPPKRNIGAQQIEIEARFVEISPEPVQPTAPANDVDTLLFGNTPENLRILLGDITGGPRLNSVLKADAYEEVIRALSQKAGVDLVSAPRVTTRTGQRAVIEIIREFRYPTEFEQAADGSGLTLPKAFETRNTGVTLEVEPEVLPDGRIELVLTPQVVEFMGFVNYRADRPARPEKGDDALTALLDPAAAAHVLNQPIFETRKLSTCIVLKPGQTALVGGMSRSDGEFVEQQGKRALMERLMRPFVNRPAVAKKVHRELYIFVTAHLVDDAGKRSIPSEIKAAKLGVVPGKEVPNVTPAPVPAQVPVGKGPVGIPVPGKPGFIMSPHASKAGYIDVRGFPSGTEVKCPYSGKMFLVP